MPHTALRRTHRKQGRSPSAPRQASHLRRMNRHAAGIDVGVTKHWGAVPDDWDAQPVRRFGACTADLYALAAWLTQCRITTVVMESTGVSWIPLFDVMDERGCNERSLM
jgi:hypothetical protein